MPLFLIIVSVLCAAGRLVIPGHKLSWPGTYEAMAHVWVGFLLAVAISPRYRTFSPKVRWLAVWMLVALTVTEVVLFVLEKKS
jgi:hypothetical protein